jgi:predicted regulator of Ras-like GTPase activity (Roadblock/LC7/MglB family)
VHWLPEALNEVRELLKEQSLLVGAMANEARSAEITSLVDQQVDEMVLRLSALDEVLCAMACRGEHLVTAHGPLIDYVALSEAAHAARWALEKVSTTFELGGVEQTVLVGAEQKLALFGAGEITFAIVSPTGVSLSEALARE